MATVNPMLADNLDSYNDGDLQTQGSWAGHSNWQIQGTVTKTGSGKAAKNILTDGIIYKDGTASADGRQRIWVRVGTLADSGISVEIRNQSGSAVAVIRFDYSKQPYPVYTNDSWVYGFFPGKPSYAKDTWYPLDFAWRVSDHKLKHRFNNGTWTSWETGPNTWTTVDEIYIAEYGI